MHGVWCARFALVTFALFGAGCARRAGSGLPATVAASAPIASTPVYRFVSLGVSDPGRQTPLAGDRLGVITEDGPGRAIVNPDGSVDLSAQEGGSLRGVVPVPERLGGGFLFWDDVLYHATSFTGQLQPIVRLSTNAVGIEFGPDYLLLLLSNSPPRAIALNPARSVPLSPKGVIDVAATDDGRALALDASGRALASTDAGKSWKDVSSALGAPLAGVDEGGQGVAFVLRGADAWLQADGQFVRRAPASTRVRERATPAELLRRAVGGGLPLPGMRALVGDGSGTRIVDLRTGGVAPIKRAGPEGSSCTPVSLDEEGVLVCTNDSSKPTTTVVSHALGATPIIEKTFVGSPHFLSARELSILADCAGGRAADRVCLRRRGGAWDEVKVSPQVLRGWQPAFWVPRENGGVSLIISEIAASQGQPKVALLDPRTSRMTPWDSTIEQVSPNSQAWRSGESLAVLADGSLRGYTAKGSIAVDPQGHVSVGTRTFASLSSAGTHALARDDAEHLWQSSDSGAHWLEIARPPFDAASASMGWKIYPRPLGRASRIDCSLNGCVLDHSTGTGFWLRLGWPQDPASEAQPNEPSASMASESKQAATSVPELSGPELAQFYCTSHFPGPLRLTIRPGPLTPHSGDQWQELLAGKRALARRGTRSFANIAYRNVFSTEQVGDCGLRAALHLSVADTALREIIGKKTPFEVLFVEPFDAQGRVRQFTTSIDDWSAFGIPAPGDAPLQGDTPLQGERWREVMGGDLKSHNREEGVARPLLSNERGRAGGVLLIGEVSFLVRNDARIQPIRPGCRALSGYLDAHGKAFVACAEPDASTHIEALDSPQRELVRAPPAAHVRARERAGLHFFPPGESLLVNPDAIAVGRDGKLRILRPPPGDFPPTTDNPAWLLSADAPPLELAPWSTLELATSPKCADGDGYRAIVQTGKSWFTGGTYPYWQVGMTALVRWGGRRVCLEAVEVGDSVLAYQRATESVHVSAVARFAGAQPGAAFIATESSVALREPATCDLRSWAELSAPQPADRFRDIRNPNR